MKINNEILIKKLNEKWKGNSCPYCQSAEWTVDASIVTPIEIGERKEMKLGGKFQPLIPVSCRNCGNTVFINGLILECLDDLDDEIKSEEENGQTK